ncbi:hypothetical protein K438DRAFT_1785452 [Mycena galopus ATCC 62051]|nr:hypothetical protein K438DRAFT_1785452 [Mycena galopus ATCC 62051]
MSVHGQKVTESEVQPPVNRVSPDHNKEISNMDDCEPDASYSERKRVSSAKYYQNKADKKARRRQSDKPRIKTHATTSTARMPTAGRAAPRPQARPSAGAAPARAATVINTAPCAVGDAEREASESLVLMSQAHTPKKLHRDSPGTFDGENSSEEEEMGVRTISEVAGLRRCIRTEAEEVEDMDPSHSTVPVHRRLRLSTPSSSRSPSPFPEPRMPSLLDYMARGSRD